MKTPILFLLFTFCSFATFAQAQTPAPVPKKEAAEVNQYSGVYVFCMSKPVREYEYIATLKKSVFAETLQDALVKYAAYAKEKYPQCDGIILNKMEGGFTKDIFDVIRFK